MIEIIWKPELHSFNSCQEFADEFRLCETDLILTNEYIYQPYFGSMNLGCRVLYQEKYGLGEPTDTMTEAIMQDMKKTGCKRVIAIGGGTVIDLPRFWQWPETRALTASTIWLRRCQSAVP